MNGSCSICNWKTRLVRDHSHTTGLIRGYICYGCNRRLVEIENGSHSHETYYFIIAGTFLIAIDCSKYHSYLENSGPLFRLGLEYRP